MNLNLAEELRNTAIVHLDAYTDLKLIIAVIEQELKRAAHYNNFSSSIKVNSAFVKDIVEWARGQGIQCKMAMSEDYLIFTWY